MLEEEVILHPNAQGLAHELTDLSFHREPREGQEDDLYNFWAGV